MIDTPVTDLTGNPNNIGHEFGQFYIDSIHVIGKASDNPAWWRDIIEAGWRMKHCFDSARVNWHCSQNAPNPSPHVNECNQEGCENCTA